MLQPQRSVIYLLLIPALTDHTQENVLDSENEAMVDDVIKKSYLDASFQCKWLPVKKQFIQNKTLEQQFEGTDSHCMFCLSRFHFIQLLNKIIHIYDVCI